DQIGIKLIDMPVRVAQEPSLVVQPRRHLSGNFGTGMGKGEDHRASAPADSDRFHQEIAPAGSGAVPEGTIIAAVRPWHSQRTSPRVPPRPDPRRTPHALLLPLQ